MNQSPPADQSLTPAESLIQAKVCVSYFGQIWPDVVLLKYSWDEKIGLKELDHRLKIYNESLSSPFESLCSAQALIDRGSVYIASFCKVKKDGGTKKSSHSHETRDVKSEGGHAPSLKWLELLFPDLKSSKVSVKFCRLRDFPITIDLLKKHHTDLGEGKQCHFRAKQSSPETLGRCEEVEIILRIHLNAPVFQYNGLSLNQPVRLTEVTSKTECTYVPLSEGGDELAVFDKPPACLAEPHVAITHACLAREIYDRFGRVAHPIHRLDRPVGGLMAVRLLPPQKRVHESALEPVKLSNKVYKAISESEESFESIISILMNKCSSHIAPDEFELISYMPPGNMFDRASPVFTSTVEHPGWKKCVTRIKLLGAQLQPLKSAIDDESVWQNSSLIKETFEEVRSRLAERSERMASFEIFLLSGRRHQIRSVMAFLGFPLYLDTEYKSLKGFDCCDFSKIESASRAHEKNRECWFDDLARLIEADDNNQLLLAKCGMWASDDELLQIMDHEPVAKIIGLHAWSVDLEVENALYNARSEFGPWWDCFFDLHGGGQRKKSRLW